MENNRAIVPGRFQRATDACVAAMKRLWYRVVRHGRRMRTGFQIVTVNRVDEDNVWLMQKVAQAAVVVTVAAVAALISPIGPLILCLSVYLVLLAMSWVRGRYIELLNEDDDEEEEIEQPYA